MIKTWLTVIAFMITILPTTADSLVYQGDEGIGKGKHIVFIANDHEYRSEQTCPLMAKILAKHHGFRCTVLFGVDQNGHIKAGAKEVPGLEALKNADLLVFFSRFMNLPDGQAQLIADYFERGGPVVGLRTSTHCFNGQKGTWNKLNYNYSGKDYLGGLGEQVFGNTWRRNTGQTHYGSNHQMGGRITPTADALDHIINTGVKRIHAYSGAYASSLPEGATSLLEVQVINTFHPSDEINQDKPLVTAGWTRDSYVAPSGTKKMARVVYTSFVASEDLLSEDGRRFLTNACFWAGGWEASIKPDLDVSIVGSYNPSAYTSGMYYEGVKPLDLAGWDSHVMPETAELSGLSEPKFLNRIQRILKNRPQLRQRLAEKYPDRFGRDSTLTP
jgi:hypothetical protein